MDIADWLRDLGLEQYTDAFRENAIGRISKSKGPLNGPMINATPYGSR